MSLLSDALDALIDSAKLLGGTEAKKIFGCYTQEDSRFRTARYESISKHRRAIEAAVLEAQSKQEPVAWCVAYDDPRMGRIHSNPTMCEPEVDAHVSKCGGVVVKVPLFAAPIIANANVQPCEHYFVVDEEAVRYKCCQRCGLIAAAEGDHAIRN